jgi:flagellar assembly factor FliW
MEEASSGRLIRLRAHGTCFAATNGMKTMATTATNQQQDITMSGQTTIHMPAGLMGFEHVKRYVLLSRPDEAPFLWLQMLDDPNLAFLCVSPLHVSPDYQPDISPADVQSLQLTKPDDAFIVSIVTLHANGQPTVNLKGPVVINRHSLVGKQVVPCNAADYASQHRLPLAR